MHEWRSWGVCQGSNWQPFGFSIAYSTALFCLFYTASQQEIGRPALQGHHLVSLGPMHTIWSSLGGRRVGSLCLLLFALASYHAAAVDIVHG